MLVQNYLYTILLADPQSPYTILSYGYCGDGGIPGYIFGAIIPNDYAINVCRQLLRMSVIIMSVSNLKNGAMIFL